MGQIPDFRSARKAELIKLAGLLGITVASDAVCQGHTAPIDILDTWVFERPPISLMHGGRGVGKSYLRALAIHLTSLMYDGHSTRVLGGSKAQSEQIYEALKLIDEIRPVETQFDQFTRTKAVYFNGSEVSILAASRTSVRGPHVPDLCLDEVDEIDNEIRESAFGMAMERDGVPSSISMTSTWHRVAGPMSELVKKGRSGEFPVWTTCIFEVLERCPDERSGPNLEHCGECPIFRWCHSDRSSHHSGLPKAKRSNGHYSIDSFIQKVRGVSLRVLESDYLCLRPSAAGLWFTDFEDSVHITDEAEFTSLLPVHISIDVGVHNAALFFQISRDPDGRPCCTVFAEYYSYDRTAELDAIKIKDLFKERTGYDFQPRGGVRVTIDSAGSARSSVGVTVIGEFQRVGLFGPRGIEHWPKYPGSVLDQLNLLASFVRSAEGKSYLRIHPRCTGLADAFRSYQRKKVDNQWLDDPEDPQHPHEEFIDALRGGLAVEFPESHKPKPVFRRVAANRVF